jgi:serine/threonine protein kinase
MWAMGVIIFSLLCGRHPFDGGNNQQRLFNKIQTCDYDFSPDSIWSKVSSECVDLIEKLLSPCVQKRLSPEQALKHDWFDSINNQTVDVINQEIIDTLIRHKKKSNFMYICNRIIMSSLIDPSK